MPNLQRDHASILLTFLCNYAIMVTQRGKHGTMPPPLKYAPALAFDGLQLRHSFFRQNHWTSKCLCKAQDITVNQRLIPSVSVFKEFDRKVKTFLDGLALVQSYQEQFKQLK